MQSTFKCAPQKDISPPAPAKEMARPKRGNVQEGTAGADEGAVGAEHYVNHPIADNTGKGLEWMLVD